LIAKGYIAENACRVCALLAFFIFFTDEQTLTTELHMPTVDLDDLENAMLFVGDPVDDAEAWVSRTTGAVYVRADHLGAGDLPADVGATDDYVAVPHPHDLDLGNELAFAFAKAQMPQHYARVREIFRKKGAYANFSRLLEAENARDQWHTFRDEQTRAALDDWCRENGLELG
jgi:hypothetical protein